MKDGNKARFLSQSNTKAHPGNAARSMPTSPALTGISSPALGPTSVPLSQQQAERMKAIRRPIIHKLALGPATENVISKYKKDDATEQEFKLALDKVADLEDGKWKLKQKAFRDLDVFTYKRYTPEERQVAIDNAIHVYDKIRLATSEPEWERLLQFEERGTGKCLSKLQAKIAVGAIKPAKAPRIKVHGAEDSGRDTPTADDLDDLFGEKIPTTALKSEGMVRSHSNPPVTKQKKTSEKEQQAKRLLAKGKATKPTSAKSTEKKSATKESSKIKSSEFVRESDEEDDYLLPAPKAAPASTTSSKVHATKAPPPKTKQIIKSSSRDEFGGELIPKLNGIQKPKVNNTSPPKSSPLASSPPTNASDFDDSSSSSSTSLKRKATDSSSDIPISKRHQKSSSNSTSSSVASSSVASSNSIVNGERHDPFYYEVMRKEVSATKRFVLYYNKYADLYRELAASQDKDRDVEKMADLLAMHERLAQMKADILPAGQT
jgi:RNA polymerase II elongation factor ELL